MRLLLLLCLGALALVGVASAANPIKATLTTSTTEPLIGEPWRYTIAVKDRAGKPLAAKVRLQILDGKRVVGCWKSGAMVRCSGDRARHVDRVQGEALGDDRLARIPRYGKARVPSDRRHRPRTLRLRAPVNVQPRP